MSKKNKESSLTTFYYNNKLLIWVIIVVISLVIIFMYVNRGDISHEGIQISIEPRDNVSVGIGNTISLRANINVSNPVIVWNSSDSTIASVQNGNVTGVNYGRAKIIAAYYDSDGKEYQSSCDVMVVEGDANVDLNDISFPEGDLYIPLGKDYKLNLVLTPANALINERMYISSDDNVVTVSQDGLIKAHHVGHARVIATVNNKYKTTKDVYVGNEYQNAELVINPTSLSFDMDTRKVKVGTVEKLNYSITPTNADRTKLTWTSNEPTIVSVNQKGEITAKSEGETTVSVTSMNGQRADIIVEVYQEIIPVSDIIVTSSDIKMEAGKTLSISPIVKPSNASNQGLSYSSLDPSIVSVSANGLGNTATLSALKKGNTTIIISSGNIEKRIKVRVTGNGNNSQVDEDTGHLPTTIRVRSNKNNLAKTYDEVKNIPVDGSTTVSVELSVGVGKIKYCINKYGDSPCTVNQEIYSDGTITIPNGAIYVLRIIKYDYNNKEISSNSINYVNGVLHYYINTKSITKLYTVTGAYDSSALATLSPSKIGDKVYIKVDDSSRYLNICSATNTTCIPNTRVTSSYTVNIDKTGTTRIYVNEYDNNNNKVGNTEVYYIYVNDDSKSKTINNGGSNIEFSNLRVYTKELIGKYLSVDVKSDLSFSTARFCYKTVNKGANDTCNLDLTSSSVLSHNGQSYFHPTTDNKTYYATFSSTDKKTLWFDIDGLDNLYDNSDTNKDVIFEFAVKTAKGFTPPIRIRINMSQRIGVDSYWNSNFIK